MFSQQKFIVTAGLRGSGSTWIFNIVRELAIVRFDKNEVKSLFADTIDELNSQTNLSNRIIIIKSHSGSAELDSWFDKNNARYILSIRDPRDAAISIHQRFGYPIGAAIGVIRQDCARLYRLIQDGHFLLRFEDRFFERFEFIRLIADHLDIIVDDKIVADLAERYSVSAVRSFSTVISLLPEQRLIVEGNDQFDRITQIHQNHVGDTSIQKWQKYSDAIKSELTNGLFSYIKCFGYMP